MIDKRSGKRLAGLVQSRQSRHTGTVVNIYRASEAGLDPDGGEWVTACEDHGALVNHETRKAAEYFAPYPGNWCEACSMFAHDPDEQFKLSE